MNSARPALLYPLILGLLAGPAFAAPLSREDVPAPLAPWVQWVLSGHEEALCPFLHGNADSRECAWPGVLTLELGETGGGFSQPWRLYADGWVAVPGEEAFWPQEVRVDGAPAAVMPRDSQPSVRLKRGMHTVSGAFRYRSLPEMLQAPAATGLVRLSVLGRAVPHPVREDSGRLWLQKALKDDTQEDSIEVSVHRLVEDDMPLRLITHIQLKVSGKNRETVLGRALPKGFIPMSLSGPLPARLDPDGRLRVQARPGTWVLLLESRHRGPAEALALSDPGGPWDQDEAWAFNAYSSLRQVNVEGPPALDPQQTELPASWAKLPTYLMKPGSVMRLSERRRGDSDPEPDRLSIDRTLWLDFDGKGLSARDTITGELNRSWRVDMGAGTKLGRVSVNGQEQFITALDSGSLAGIEIRAGTLDLSADSRYEGGLWRAPAVGWNHDFERVSGRLNLPPGWRLLHAGGVDKAEPTWISAWTLLDLFLVLILALSVGRLWGRPWGLAALACSALCWHEPGALRWLWLFPLAAEALSRVLPEGGLKPWIFAARRAALAALVFFAVPFLITQVRTALYPQLEPTYPQARWFGFGGFSDQAAGPTAESGAVGALNARDPAALVMGSGGESRAYSNVAAEGEPEPEGETASKDSKSIGDELEYSRRKMKMDKSAPIQSVPPGAPSPKRKGAEPTITHGPQSSALRPYTRLLISHFNILDPRSVINTGPGIPAWTWRSVDLSWSGPVSKDQKLRLWLVSPRMRFLATGARIALVSLLILLFLGFPVGGRLAPLLTAPGRREALRRLLPVLLLAWAAPASRAYAEGTPGQPSAEILEELRTRLLEKPDCAPLCAEIPRMRLEATVDRLSLRLEAHAAAPTALPLPGGAKQWLPVSASLDGNPAGVRRSEDGTLWLALPAGTHQVALEGPLPPLDSVQLSLPLKPKRVEHSESGWTLFGVEDDATTEGNLQLSRSQRAASGSPALAQGSYPPFVLVERTLILGLSWLVETRVVRLTPTGAPVSLEVPLLPGESVNMAGLQVMRGKARVEFSPQAQAVEWRSSLQTRESLRLSAPDSASWLELWRLSAAPIWHVETTGIPAVHAQPGRGPRLREWRPWPGESVELSVSRPEGVSGQTLTIDKSELSAQPGKRAEDITLSLSLRSSRGAQHALTLPEGAELKSVRIDGSLEPIRQEDRGVVLPVQPGSHSVELSWRQNRGARMFYRTPKTLLGASSVNASLGVSMPADRWTLLLGGPRLGPAVLFWSLLAVFLLVSLGLGRLGWTPLGWRQWFLLSFGLTQVPITSSAIVACWLLALGLRGRRPPEGNREFDMAQAFLAGLALFALLLLFRSIKQGLLGLPDMQIAGNSSSAQALRWYQDKSGDALPRAWVFSVPLWFYRAAMLAWALWLANSLLAWLKWGWGCFSTDGLWKPLRSKLPKSGETR